MKPRHKKLALVGGLQLAVGAVVGLVLNAFQINRVFLYSPKQVAAQQAPAGRTFRLGGLVEVGSVKREGTRVNCAVTDTARTVPLRYEGLLPDLSSSPTWPASRCIALLACWIARRKALAV